MQKLKSARKHLTASQKTQLLRDLLENQKSIRAVSKKYGVHPNYICKWIKQLFEEAPLLFMNKNQSRNIIQRQNRKIFDEILRDSASF